MRTAPPTLSRNAQINLVPAQSHIVCCPTAFRPDFRRRLPDQEWRSSRVRRRLLRRLKVFQVSGAHGATAPPAKPTPLARSRTQPPLPPSPPLRFCAVDATQWQCLPPGEFDSPPGGREGSPGAHGSIWRAAPNPPRAPACSPAAVDVSSPLSPPCPRRSPHGTLLPPPARHPAPQPLPPTPQPASRSASKVRPDSAPSRRSAALTSDSAPRRAASSQLAS